MAEALLRGAAHRGRVPRPAAACQGPRVIEFVPMDVDPLSSNASCCLRVDDLHALYASFAEAGLSGDCRATPRLDPPRTEEHGLRMFALIDPDGNLVRCIQN